jgi:hypothetical protein
MVSSDVNVEPIAFVVMPFDRKPTGVAESGAPAVVDFDALWRRVYLPVLSNLGYKAVRADRDVGALIISEMIQRLALADLVVADLSLPNANVYYEIGVRHAAKRVGQRRRPNPGHELPRSQAGARDTAEPPPPNRCAGCDYRVVVPPGEAVGDLRERFIRQYPQLANRWNQLRRQVRRHPVTLRFPPGAMRSRPTVRASAPQPPVVSRFQP